MEDNIKLFDYIKKNEWNEFIKYINKHDNIDLNIRDNFNNYLLTYAVIANQLKAAEILIKKGSRIDVTDLEERSIIYYPIRYSYDKMIDLLINSNKDTLGISILDIKDKLENIPLHYAIYFKNRYAINKLIDAGSNLNITDSNGNNSLHLAIIKRDYETTKKLLTKDININSRNYNGENALHIACNFKNLEIIKLLLKNNIDVNAQDYDHQFTPLHYSINLDNTDITLLLLNNGANPNIQDFIGNTVVHYTIIEDNYEVLVYLMTSQETKFSVNINLFNIDMNLPIHILLEKIDDNKMKFLKYLLEGSNLNFQNNNGNTPFFLLCLSKYWKNSRKEKIRHICLKQG